MNIKKSTYSYFPFVIIGILITQAPYINADAFTDFFTKTIPQTAQQVAGQVQQKVIDPLVEQANQLPAQATQVVNTLLSNVPTDAAQKIGTIKSEISSIQSIATNLQQQLNQTDSAIKKLSILMSNVKNFQTQVQRFLKSKTAQDILQAWFIGDPTFENLFTLHDQIVNEINNLDLRPLIGNQTSPGVAGILKISGDILGNIVALRDIFNRIKLAGTGGLGSLVISDPQASVIQALSKAFATMSKGAYTIASGALNPISKTEGKLLRVALNTPERLNELSKLQQVLIVAQTTVSQLQHKTNDILQAADTLKNEATGLQEYIKAKVDQKAQDWRIWLGVGISGAAVLAVTAADALKERIEYLRQKTINLVLQARDSATLVQRLIDNAASVLSTIKTSVDIDLFTQPVIQGIALLQQGAEEFGKSLQALTSVI